MRFKKTIVWGCGLHQHTNSYVYAAFHKAFMAMGFDSYWLDGSSDVSGMDFSDSLFITEGQHDGGIPIRDDCKYVLHNCSSQKWQAVKPENKIALQVYTDDAKDRWKATPLGDGAYILDRCLFQPWATDLLPHEIDLSWASAPRSHQIHWVGTIGGGQFGNENEINAFRSAAADAGIPFHYHPPGSTSFEDNKRLIQESYLAPAIHGTWQAQNGYVACRVFKNISYGQLGCTNSKAAHEMLDGNLVFNQDPHQLFFDARAKMTDVAFVQRAMSIVRDKHTYVNRINTIISFL